MGQKASSNANQSDVVPSGPRFTHKELTIFTKKHSHPVYGKGSIMSKKAHGTSDRPVQDGLRWGCDFQTADRICNYNRHYAEHSGYFSGKRKFLQAVDEAKRNKKKIEFYDSVTGHLLFVAPGEGRTWDGWMTESRSHGWPSFRDNEVNWQYVRCLRNGECISVDGTHLGHNLPDRKGNRYCINLVSCAGHSIDEAPKEKRMDYPVYEEKTTEEQPKEQAVPPPDA